MVKQQRQQQANIHFPSSSLPENNQTTLADLLK